jgi:hypothetical protein
MGKYKYIGITSEAHALLKQYFNTKPYPIFDKKKYVSMLIELDINAKNNMKGSITSDDQNA